MISAKEIELAKSAINRHQVRELPPKVLTDEELFAKACRKVRISIADVKNPCRRMDMVKKRRKVAAILREHGLGYKRSAKVMGRTHSAIVHMIKQNKKGNK